MLVILAMYIVKSHNFIKWLLPAINQKFDWSGGASCSLNPHWIHTTLLHWLNCLSTFLSYCQYILQWNVLQDTKHSYSLDSSLHKDYTIRYCTVRMICLDVKSLILQHLIQDVEHQGSLTMEISAMYHKIQSSISVHMVLLWLVITTENVVRIKNGQALCLYAVSVIVKWLSVY